MNNYKLIISTVFLFLLSACGGGDGTERFSNAFDAFMLKKNGEQLTLEEFRNKYHSLID